MLLQPMKIHVSETTAENLDKKHYNVIERGTMAIKVATQPENCGTVALWFLKSYLLQGKGSMKTYWVNEKTDDC